MEITGAVNTLVVKQGRKKFRRISNIQLDGKETVVWKRDKSNHAVNSATSKELESEFELMSTGFLKVSEGLSNAEIKTLDRMDKEVKKLVEEGSLLAAVKYVKNETDWGLKDSKTYVDSLIGKIKK